LDKLKSENYVQKKKVLKHTSGHRSSKLSTYVMKIKIFYFKKFLKTVLAAL
jgi:hypothetical protein